MMSEPGIDRRIEALLEQGMNTSEIAKRLGLPYRVVAEAIRDLKARRDGWPDPARND